MDRRRMVAPAQARDEEAWIAKTVFPCSELRLDHTTSLKGSTPKLVPFRASRERNSEHRHRQPRAGRTCSTSVVPEPSASRSAKEIVMNWMIVLAVALSVVAGSCAPTKPAIVGTGTYQVIDLGVHRGFEIPAPKEINSVVQVSGSRARNREPARRAFFYDTPH